MKRYLIADHSGNYHIYTARKFHDVIMEDANQSYYNWHAPVQEIARAVKTFPKEYRDDIYRAVLKCFAYLQIEHQISPSEQEAIWRCFLMLEPDEDKNDKAKKNYAHCLINKAIKTRHFLSFHLGDSWGNFCQTFRDEKNAEWPKLKSSEELTEWAKGLHEEFAKRLEKAETAGIFKEDYEKESRKIDELIKNAVVAP